MGSPLFSGVSASTAPCQQAWSLSKARKTRVLGAKNMYFLGALNSKGSLRSSGLCSSIFSHAPGFESYVFFFFFFFLFDNN
ncbi:hypothetical protein Bca4012_043491 [Brassica carinata]|uniref:(rape) hypothetical protein n=1 Tax=Brassica napus TaxID=3708 RepID=A0A816IWK7_BRANA|nr:unnamed protein product [Brassica napus]